VELRSDLNIKGCGFTWISKDSYFYIFILILISSNLNLEGQKLAVDNSNFFYQISPVFDFKQSILSLTFDDGYITQFTIALPLLKERNLPATFYVITNEVDSVKKNMISKNLSKDYEIGSHTVTHANLVKIGNEDAKMEMLNSHSFLQRNFGINAGLTLSYPWGFYNSSVEQTAKDIYLAARSTNVGYNSLYKLDRFTLKMQGFNSEVSAYEANQWVDFAIENHLWLVEMIHGINEVGYLPVDARVLTEHGDYIAKVKDKIWCSTVSDVVKYLEEAKNAEIVCDICSDTVYKFRIDDFLNDSVFNQPLSLRIKVPSNWNNIWISDSIKLKTEYFNKCKFILFNALPDNKEITIRPKSVSIPEKESGIRIVYLSGNPFFDNLRLSLEVFDQQDIDIILCDINGKLIIHHKEKNVIGVINVVFDTSGLKNGVFFLKLESPGSGSIIKKLIKV
jgi:peptidoglycan/xylan/chitin deacetylase (PgdA/CDA1 family)